MQAWDLETLWRLGIALAVGLLIGFERGFHQRAADEGARVAGFRTFALIGLAGGLTATLALAAPAGGDWLPPAVLLALAGLMLLGAHHQMRQNGDVGMTTEVAALLAFLLGLAAGFGEKSVAAMGAVAVVLLLGLKAPLHALLRRLDEREVLAVVKLLVISLLMLPLLPDEPMGPWGALNPHRLWWMVVLVAGLSSAGYFAMKFFGSERGLVATALLGGLVSSTATTAAMARRARGVPEAARLSAAAALAACAVLPLRVALVTAVLSPDLAWRLAPPLAALFLATLGAAVLLWRRGRRDGGAADLGLGNPFELWPALQLAALLAVVFLLSEALPRWIGTGGLYLLAAVGGLADVDAITLSYGAKAGQGAMALTTAAWGILAATAVNNAVKAGLALSLGGRAVGLLVAAGLGAATLLAALALLLPF